MNQKGFIILLAAIVITALLVGGGTYYYQQTIIKQQTEKALLKINSLEKEIRYLETELDFRKTDITDWLTYESSSYSFKYPSHYVFEENIFGGPHVIVDTLFRNEQEKKMVMSITRIFPDPLPDGEPDEEPVKTAWRPDYHESVKATSERIIGGQKAYMFILPEGNLLFKFADENFSRSKAGFSIKFHNVNILNDELNQILDSFNFNFLDSTSEGQVYNDFDLGFTFSYPSEFLKEENNELFGQLFSSPEGHFWLNIKDNEKNLKTAQEIKDDFYANDSYGYKYEDSFIKINGIDIYKQGRYDLGTIENYYFLNNNKLISLSFEFNHDHQDKILQDKYKILISDIVNSINNISDWQVYTNEEFKFSISIPKEIVVKEQENSRIIFALTENKYFSIHIDEKNLDPSGLCYDGVCNAQKINIMDRDFYNLSYGDAGWGFNFYYTYINGHTFTFTFGSSEAENIWDYSEINNILTSFNAL